MEGTTERKESGVLASSSAADVCLTHLRKEMPANRAMQHNVCVAQFIRFGHLLQVRAGWGPRQQLRGSCLVLATEGHPVLRILNTVLDLVHCDGLTVLSGVYALVVCCQHS